MIIYLKRIQSEEFNFKTIYLVYLILLILLNPVNIIFMEYVMSRFFVSPQQIEDGHVYITGTDVVHISRVLRLGPGAPLTVLDGRGKAYEAVIEQVGTNEIVCCIRKEFDAATAPPIKITLVQGIPKGNKMDLIIEKGTELGVSRFIPLTCRRAVVKLEDGRSVKKLERWQRIAMESAKQCRRPDIPEVSEPADWGKVLSGMPPHAAGLIPWEEEDSQTLKDFLEGSPPGEEIYVFIGPEGGFDPGEVEMARERGICPVSLGSRILRTETAGIAVVTMVLYQWGDLGGKRDG